MLRSDISVVDQLMPHQKVFVKVVAEFLPEGEEKRDRGSKMHLFHCG